MKNSSGRLKILLLSHTAEGGSFKVGSHHLAREFSLMGFDVAHVSTPVSVFHLLLAKGDPRKRKLALAPGIRDEHGTYHSVPLVFLPLQVRGSSRALRRHLKRIGYWDAHYILVDQPLMGDLVGKSTPGAVVYRPTDEVSARIAVGRQKELLKHVDGVVATSAKVLDSLTVRNSIPTTVIENGVEFSRFVAPPGRVSRTGIVYAGALDHRFDWNVIVSIANEFPTISVRLIGPIVSEPPPLPENVKLVGPVAYGDLPALLQSAAVGLLPFNDAFENAGRSPMKYYEYLAAGMYVVATRTPELERRSAPGVLMYSGAEEAIDAVRQSLARDAPNDAGRDDAEKYDWHRKATELVTFMTSLPRGVKATNE